MGKVLSFATLVLVTGAFGVLFFEVTSTLLLPLFLAMVIVVMFRPLHLWFVRLLRGRSRAAAVITTALVLLVVVTPLMNLDQQVVGVHLSRKHREVQFWCA